MKEYHSADNIKSALLETIRYLNQWAREEAINEVSLLNFAVSDGQVVVCSRYVNSTTVEPASLFFSTGTFKNIIVVVSVNDGVGSRFEQSTGSPTTYKMVCKSIQSIAIHS